MSKCVLYTVRDVMTGQDLSGIYPMAMRKILDEEKSNFTSGKDLELVFEDGTVVKDGNVEEEPNQDDYGFWISTEKRVYEFANCDDDGTVWLED
ncbi:hypothetical protein D3C73_1296680 [compost metagenome]